MKLSLYLEFNVDNWFSMKANKIIRYSVSSTLE
jgi:hypothetical protein